MKDEKTGELANKVISQLTPDALQVLWPKMEPELSRQIIKVGVLI